MRSRVVRKAVDDRGVVMPVYLDHAATTPMLPEAIAAYAEAMSVVGNPSSIHSQGQHAKQLLEEARESIAASLGCEPIEVVFTSGGTESINLALKGIFWARNARSSDGAVNRRVRIIAPGGEHHATVDTLEWLAHHEGAAIEWIPLDPTGLIRMDALQAAVSDEPESIALITALWVNNEVGTIQPTEHIAEIAARAGVPFHSDAVAAYGHLPLDFSGLRAASASASAGLVAMSVSAHKIGGPVGIGALALSRSAAVEPLVHGGGQQRQVRSGTQDVAAAVSFAVAARIAVQSLESERIRLGSLRDRLVRGVRESVPKAILTGPSISPTSQQAGVGERVESNAHFVFPGAQGDSLLFLLDLAGISVSTGSACQAGIPEPSHVLIAMGRSEQEARGALRITLGRTTTEADVDAFLAALPAAYAQAARAGLAERATTIGS
jgi:cysteine desulfurase